MEGVDRNTAAFQRLSRVSWSPSSWRAWIEIQLDHRNAHGRNMSPSSWRAWIEIFKLNARCHLAQVTLLVEGVDRNTMLNDEALLGLLSPSSWRAWIEIQNLQNVQIRKFVALLAEGVDRNRHWRLC